MSPNLIRRELLRDHLMLNEDITLFDDERVIGNNSIYDEEVQIKGHGMMKSSTTNWMISLPMNSLSTSGWRKRVIVALSICRL